jgi:hypothetical protein
MSQLKYLRTTVTDKIWFRKKLRWYWILAMFALIRSKPSVFSSAVEKVKN